MSPLARPARLTGHPALRDAGPFEHVSKLKPGPPGPAGGPALTWSAQPGEAAQPEEVLPWPSPDISAELPEAVPCNPFDVEGLSQRIEHALRLPAATRRSALAAMARHVRRHDVHRWVAGQLAGIASRGAAR
ncbi:MAG TPA: hypothetical protein VEH31_09720 [Streptosporangiaceae bacterium]|nr:hypothetical protein [Streptosporangiaceae bacterium]HYA53144.1 hypothetical protein [Streptosporangiaceae bacterium]